MRTKDEVRQIAHRYADLVRQKYDPERIILFGSQVNGTPNEYSDIDIAVVFNAQRSNKRQISADLWDISNQMKSRIEPHFFDETWDPLGFLDHVKETGKVIYKKKGSESNRPVRINMDDKIYYWLKLCDRDLHSATIMLKENMDLEVLYHCHLTLEKALKAVITSQSKEMPPRTHILTDLVKLAGLEHYLSATEHNLLQRLNDMHVETTYPSYDETETKPLTIDECKTIVQETTDFLNMIKQRLAVSC